MNFDGIEYELTRKNVKRMNIRVTSDGIVKVSAPKFVAKGLINSFISENKEWILKKQKEVKSKPQPIIHDFKSGETYFLWGQRYTLSVIYDYVNFIYIDGDYIILKTSLSDRNDIEMLFLNWYKQELETELNKFVVQYESLTNLKCSSYKIKDLKSKWGSCKTSTGELFFNLQLVKLPKYCLEYVVLHELCHLKVPNHSADFKAELTKYMPDWKSVDKQLSTYRVNKGV